MIKDIQGDGRCRPSAAEPGAEPRFARRLGLLDTALLVVGAVVGSGIFLTSGHILHVLPSPGLLLLVWLAGGLITICGALSFAELGGMFPEAGGPYIYIREAYGPAAGFLFGWAFFWFIMGGGLAALAVGFAEFLSTFFPALSMDSVVVAVGAEGTRFSVSAGQLVAAAAILLLTAVNTRGIRTSAVVQNVLTYLRVGPVVVLVVLGLTMGERSGVKGFGELLSTGGLSGANLVKAFGLALVAVFWTYDGWYAASCTAGEVRNPGRNLTLGLLLGTLAVTVLYTAVNVVYVLAVPVRDLAGVTRVAEVAGTGLFGSGAASFLAALIAVSVFGCLDANIIMGPRVFFAMARDGCFFRDLGRLGTRSRVPVRALWAQAAWSVVLCLWGTYRSLYEYLVFALLLFFAATGLALFRLRRRRPLAPRPYRAWGYPVVPAFFVLASLGVFLNTVASSPFRSLVGLGLLASGGPAYLIWRKRTARPDEPEAPLSPPFGVK
ncbi:MAG: amino acid permease [Candidatus Aminicenantes bacterium]|nr:amino acid permease [Candidatus Aminicenantes bacterium]